MDLKLLADIKTSSEKSENSEKPEKPEKQEPETTEKPEKKKAKSINPDAKKALDSKRNKINY
jgi:hypothetical protein